MYLFTSEAVSPGHPDKWTDIIVGRLIREDSSSRVASEVFVEGKHVVIDGEVTTKTKLDEMGYKTIVLDVLTKIGYNGKAAFSKEECLHPDDVEVLVLLNRQPPEINQDLDQEGGEIDAGDKRIMFGYADVVARGQVSQSDYQWEQLDALELFTIFRNLNT